MGIKIKYNKKSFDIEAGSIEDDAQYMSLLERNSSSEDGFELFTCKSTSGRIIKAVLQGEPLIINSKGVSVDKHKEYLAYLKKGREGILKLNFERKSYIELLEGKSVKGTRTSPLAIVFNMADAVKILEEEVD